MRQPFCKRNRKFALFPVTQSAGLRSGIQRYSLSQPLKVDFAFDDCFNLSYQHSDLRHRVFSVDGDRLTVRAEYHELMARAGIMGRQSPAREVYG
jgi:hypothetical protein